jgi:uncharacterized SAM-dependent methyltransferase
MVRHLESSCLAVLGRIEMHLISQRKQLIRLGNKTFYFNKGESLHTENSYQYSEYEFQYLAQKASWHPKKLWTNRDGWFNLHYLSLSADEPRHLPLQGC